jgi:8-oxo-dGTP pyrophosphatase MutT (NUDIX family)
VTSVSAAPTHLIHIAAALLLNAQGQTLLVRKRGTTAFMQPGGKIEAHELPIHALARELEEELGLQIDPAQASFLGQFSAPAANEPGFVVHADIFQLTIDADVIPAAEIEEVIWVDPATDPALELAPLTREHILPFYRRSLTAFA